MSQVSLKSYSEAETQQRIFESEIIALIPALRAFAFRFCRAREEIDDLVQETLLKALRFRSHFQPETNLKSWLFTIMRNHFFTQFKCRKRETVMEDNKLELLLISAPGQEWAAYQHDVGNAIDRLPATFRSALLQISSGVSYEDAAQSMGCEVGTIKSRVNRARHQLAEQFSDLFAGRDAYAL